MNQDRYCGKCLKRLAFCKDIVSYGKGLYHKKCLERIQELERKRKAEKVTQIVPSWYSNYGKD